MKNKLLTILFIALIFGIQNGFSQTKSQITKIRADVAAINKDAAKYKKTKRDVEGISLEGAEATYFSLGENLKKTTAKIYGETYNADAEVYYENNKPIFIYQKLNKYDMPISPTKSPKILSVEETRAYYADGEIIRILIGKNEMNPTDVKFAEVKDDLKEFSDTLYKVFKDK